MCVSPVDDDAPLDTYGQIVAHYIANFRARQERELRCFRSKGSLQQVIDLVGYGKMCDGKHHPHHWRRRRSALRRAHAELSRCDFGDVTSFDELYEKIDEAIGNVSDIGELFVYDAAQSIGAFLRLIPRRVYLHRGTRAGARILGLGKGCVTLEKAQLPRAFQRLRPYEIEDCLCMYKDDLALIRRRLARRARLSRRPS